MKLSFFSWLLFFLMAAAPASAHILQTDGTVGAVLHVDPEDSPIVGQPSTFFFEFKDTAKKFTLDTCECTGIISQNGKEIYSVPLLSTSFSYVFKEKNIYQVKVTGKPVQGNTFQPFALTYDIRVDRQASSTPASAPSSLITAWLKQHVLHSIAAVVLTIVTFLLIIHERVVESRRNITLKK